MEFLTANTTSTRKTAVFAATLARVRSRFHVKLLDNKTWSVLSDLAPLNLARRLSSCCCCCCYIVRPVRHRNEFEEKKVASKRERQQ